MPGKLQSGGLFQDKNKNKSIKRNQVRARPAASRARAFSSIKSKLEFHFFNSVLVFWRAIKQFSKLLFYCGYHQLKCIYRHDTIERKRERERGRETERKKEYDFLPIQHKTTCYNNKSSFRLFRSQIVRLSVLGELHQCSLTRYTQT